MLTDDMRFRCTQSLLLCGGNYAPALPMPNLFGTE
jgi:hypothetical protein